MQEHLPISAVGQMRLGRPLLQVGEIGGVGPRARRPQHQDKGQQRAGTRARSRR